VFDSVLSYSAVDYSTEVLLTTVCAVRSVSHEVTARSCSVVTTTCRVYAALIVYDDSVNFTRAVRNTGSFVPIDYA
jgi:hypothetical protein